MFSVKEEADVALGGAGVGAQEAVRAEEDELARPGLGRCGKGRWLVVSERRRRELVEQVGEGGFVVAGSLEAAELLEQLEQRLVVVVGAVARAVVDEQDPLGLLCVGVDEGGGDLGPAEVAGGPQRVVSGQDLAVRRLTRSDGTGRGRRGSA